MTFLQFSVYLFEKGGSVSSLPAVSFQQISQILELTDQLEISREVVVIPLSYYLYKLKAGDNS